MGRTQGYEVSQEAFRKDPDMALRLAICTLACAIEFGGAALAQAAGPDAVPSRYLSGHDAATAPSLYGQVAHAPQSPANIAPDVTVTGRRQVCGKRDMACINSVSAEIWTEYPKQIEQLCATETFNRIKEGFVEQELGIAGIRNDRLTPATRRLCEYGKRMHLEHAALAPASAAPPP